MFPLYFSWGKFFSSFQQKLKSYGLKPVRQKAGQNLNHIGPKRRTDRRASVGPSKAPLHEERKSKDPHQRETLVPFLAGSGVNQKVPVTRVDIQIQDQESNATQAHVMVRKHMVDLHHSIYKKAPTYSQSEALGLVLEAQLADKFWESPCPGKHVVFPIIWVGEVWSQIAKD